jgi:hypothetical protein
MQDPAAAAAHERVAPPPREPVNQRESDERHDGKTKGRREAEQDLEDLRLFLIEAKDFAKKAAAKLGPLVKSQWQYSKELTKEQTRLAVLRAGVAFHLWLLVLAFWVVLNITLFLAVLAWTAAPAIATLAVTILHLVLIISLALYMKELKL